jgi:hypothetical protein
LVGQGLILFLQVILWLLVGAVEVLGFFLLELLVVAVVVVVI